MPSIHTLLLLLALICFLLATINIPVPVINLVALGLLFLTLAFMVGG